MFTTRRTVLAAAVLFAFAASAVFAPLETPAAAQAVRDKVFVPSGDTEIFVEIKGPKNNAPVALFLHEGPATPLGIMAFQAYPGPELEKTFIMAYMHQRGVLRSPDVPDSSHTIANYLADIGHVVEYLKKRFDRPRVHLIGHAWGGTLAYLYVLEHPDNVEKIAAVAAPFDVPATQFASYEMTLQWARDANATGAIQDLTGVGSPPYAHHKQLLTKTLWSAEALGGLARNLDSDSVVTAAGYAQYDPAWGDEQMRVNEIMFDEVSRIDVEDEVAAARTPLLLIAGRDDAEAPYFVLKRGFDRWGGKDWGGEKKFLIFENSHHIPFTDETSRFVQEVRAFLAD